jgi:hypothetical protein
MTPVLRFPASHRCIDRRAGEKQRSLNKKAFLLKKKLRKKVFA